MFVDIISFCSLSVLFCLFLHPPSFIFYVFLFLSFVLSLITCTIFIGDTITTIPCLFNYKCLVFKATLTVVWQPSGYMVRAFHWQYADILLAIYIFFFTYYFVLSLKNKYTILSAIITRLTPHCHFGRASPCRFVQHENSTVTNSHDESSVSTSNWSYRKLSFASPMMLRCMSEHN